MAGAAALFRGEFLEGFGLRDAPGFEDWQRAEADALRRELAAVLARLTRGDRRRWRVARSAGSSSTRSTSPRTGR